MPEAGDVVLRDRCKVGRRRQVRYVARRFGTSRYGLGRRPSDFAHHAADWIEGGVLGRTSRSSSDAGARNEIYSLRKTRGGCRSNGGGMAGASSVWKAGPVRLDRGRRDTSWIRASFRGQPLLRRAGACPWVALGARSDVQSTAVRPPSETNVQEARIVGRGRTACDMTCEASRGDLCRQQQILGASGPTPSPPSRTAVRCRGRTDVSTKSPFLNRPAMPEHRLRGRARRSLTIRHSCFEMVDVPEQGEGR